MTSADLPPPREPERTEGTRRKPLRVRRRAGLILALGLVSCRSTPPAVTGRATYGGTLPANAVLEAVLLELPAADRGGRVIGSALVGGPGPSPVSFRIPYDQTQIDGARRYAVRGRLLADRSVLYLTENGAPVLTQGHGRDATLTMVRADLTRQLPATFAGTLPCDGCDTLRYQLELLPDSVFYMRAVRLHAGGPAGQRDSTARDDIGRWTLNADGSRLLLRGTRTDSFAAFGASMLRPLDPSSSRGAGAPASGLFRTSAAAPLEPALTLLGRYRQTPAGGVFTDCRTGRPLPVGPAGAGAALVAAYRRAAPRGDSGVVVRLEGRIVRSGAEHASTISVTRLLEPAGTPGC